MSQYAPAPTRPRKPTAQKAAQTPAPAVSPKAAALAAPAKTAKGPEALAAKPERPRGFAAMAPDLQRAIASKGGRIAHERGTAHEFTSEEARRAGKKGGEVVARDRAHMAEIGAKGGSHPKRKAAQRKAAQPVLQ